MINPNTIEEVEWQQQKAKIEVEIEKEKMQFLERRLKAIEKDEFCTSVDVEDLSLVSDLILLPKFKMLEFEKYKGTTSPQAHIKMFIRKMTSY